LSAVLALAGVDYRPAGPDVVLPLGISFYTFETVSYAIDVYRRRIRPADSFLDYALFLTFFPHLVAGPIVRAGDFLPQCATPPRAGSRQVGWGLTLIVLGLFAKVILADRVLAPVADRVFGRATAATFTDAWTGVLAFAGQIYFDFSGYSLCALGTALCFGFVLRPNFHFPYAAVGFSDFWRRWHISLSTWLRDYLYIPLGGNRKGPARTVVNLAITMLLGGLWHGASWMFLAWGGLHAVYLVGERLLVAAVGGRPWATGRLATAAGALATFVLVSVAWVFFRAPDLATALELLSKMFRPDPAHYVLMRYQVRFTLLVVGALLLAHLVLRDSSLAAVAERAPAWLKPLVLAFLLACLALAPGGGRDFVYFQF
jgi:alginate O-acetyltransferase complex protein AlgI